MLKRPGEKLTIFEHILIWFQNLQFFAGILIAVWFAVRLVWNHGPAWFAFASHILGIYGAQSTTAAAVIVAGVCAHWFKQKKQKWYGMVEVAFGGVAGWSICFTLAPGQALFSQWAALVGCAYVIARGLNNWAEANEKMKPKLTAGQVAAVNS